MHPFLLVGFMTMTTEQDTIASVSENQHILKKGQNWNKSFFLYFLNSWYSSLVAWLTGQSKEQKEGMKKKK
jgi:hypothetical protein